MPEAPPVQPYDIHNQFLVSNARPLFARLESGKARYRIVLDADFCSA